MLKWSKVFSALSNETRLRIFLLLLQENLCVCEIISITGIEQSLVSHSLKELSNCQLVQSKRESQRIRYFVPSEILQNSVIRSIQKEILLSKDDLKKLKLVKKFPVRSIKNERKI